MGTRHVAGRQALRRAAHALLIAGSILASSIPLAISQDAARILDRPNRLGEEVAAHSPPPAPLEALFSPRRAMRDRYPAVEIIVPPGMEPGGAFWMDNRYLVLRVSDIPSGTDVRHQIFLADAENGRSHFYKDGQLLCYRGGNIFYQAGPPMAFIRSGSPEALVWHGPIGSEQAAPGWVTGANGKPLANTYRPEDCTLSNADEARARAIALGGVFHPEPRKEETPVWGVMPLAHAEHGFFANHLPTLRPLTVVEQDAYVGVHWFRPNGEKRLLPLHLRYEIGPRPMVRAWSPWLRRYAFVGRHGKKSDVVLFDPASGEIVKIPRPQKLLHEAQVYEAAPTRAGFLWANNARPWGLYVSRGEDVRRVSSHRTQNRPFSVSPDGCKVAVRFDPDHGADTRNVSRLEILDFCDGHERN